MSNAELGAFLGQWLPRLEDEMHVVLHNEETAVAQHYGMLHYHMGWANEELKPQRYPSGKRIRPMLCLLACAEIGGDPVQAIPAATAIELLHNFSLIHDDIEDGDEVRRHRPTVWKLWGAPQAINVGDGLFALAFAALQRSRRYGVASRTTLRALDLFTQSCLALTEGQHLDMRFEQRATVRTEEYLRMIRGKTAALIGASAAIGAVVGGATEAQVEAFQSFGRAAGLAFQIQDDILGIWGDPAVTGKAAGNDILRRKKSLPILYTLNHKSIGEPFAALLSNQLDESNVALAIAYMNQAGARAYAEGIVQTHFDNSLAALKKVLGNRTEQSMLWALVDSLLHRQA